MPHLLVDIRKVSKSASIGNKAKSIQTLINKKYKVPKTYVIFPHVKNNFKVNPTRTLSKLKAEIDVKIDNNKSYAIRSSANIEDQDDYSFAGQFTTILGVKGSNNIVDSVTKVWNSAEETDKNAYANNINKVTNTISISVIIQEMVEPTWSGVAFSINPVNGRNEIVIEAVKGLGNSLVQDGKTPYRWVFSQGNWENVREENSPGIIVLNKIVSDIVKLKKRRHNEIDIEWAHDGHELNYLQLRRVTTKKFPTIYSNHLSREFLPGLIKPLVWSVNIPLVNGAWLHLLQKIIGRTKIKPEQLSHAFHYRAYFNMGTMGTIFEMMGLPKNSLENLMGRKDTSGKNSFKPTFKTLLLLPRMTWFLLSNVNIAKNFEKNIKKLHSETLNLEKQLDAGFKTGHYKTYFNKILDVSSKLAYYNIVIPILMHITTGILRKNLKKIGINYAEALLLHEFPQLKKYNPQNLLDKLHNQWELFTDEQKTEITKNILTNNIKSTSSDFDRDFKSFIETFGHLSESGNDFSVPTWKENKEFILNVLIEPPPSEKNKEPGNHNISKEIALINKNRRLSGKFKRAGKYRIYREIISSEYTRGYGLFRKLFIQVARHLSQTGIIENVEDIFYLNIDELEQTINNNNNSLPGIKDKIRAIKQEMKNAEDLTLPSVIYGEKSPLAPKPNEKLLHGIPISSGNFQGKTVVVKGYKDFSKAVEGCVLVIPFSDVSWTPILTKAGAIVSESGGILSHASIIARELGIPAIASVDNACNIEDGTQVLLDCNNGSLLIQDKL